MRISRVIKLIDKLPEGKGMCLRLNLEGEVGSIDNTTPIEYMVKKGIVMVRIYKGQKLTEKHLRFLCNSTTCKLQSKFYIFRCDPDELDLECTRYSEEDRCSAVFTLDPDWGFLCEVCR